MIINLGNKNCRKDFTDRKRFDRQCLLRPYLKHFTISVVIKSLLACRNSENVEGLIKCLQKIDSKISRNPIGTDLIQQVHFQINQL